MDKLTDIELIKCHLELIDIRFESFKELLLTKGIIKSDTTYQYMESIKDYLKVIDVKFESAAVDVSLEQRRLFLADKLLILQSTFEVESEWELDE